MRIKSASGDVFNQVTPSGNVDQTSTETKPSNHSNSNSSLGSSATGVQSSIDISSEIDKSDFVSFLKSALGPGRTQVSEEELFAGLIHQRLNEKSAEIGQFYADKKQELISQRRRSDGYVPYEEIALEALNLTVSSGKLSKEDAEMVNGEAFDGAQLDSNLSALYDDRGGENDPTKAVASLDEAMQKSKAAIDAFKNGTTPVAARSLEAGPTGAGNQGSAMAVSSVASGIGLNGVQSLDGSGGFLWKPTSESDGKLVVLLPQIMAGLVENLEIHSSLPPSESSKIEEGDYKYDSNGGRPTFRFDKPGSDYGDGVYVVARNKDGSTASWQISDASGRND